MPRNAEPKWLYRLESMNPNNGLWYDANGRYVWGIGEVEDCQTKYLPMGFDWRYQQDGKDWFSSCSRAEDLTHWFSLEDAEELIRNGFEFAMYLAVDYHEYEMETVFLKETALERRVVDVKDVFNGTL